VTSCFKLFQLVTLDVRERSLLHLF